MEKQKRTGKLFEEKLSTCSTLYISTLTEKADIVTVTLNGKFLLKDNDETYERNISLCNRQFKRWWTTTLANELKSLTYKEKYLIFDMQIGVGGNVGKKPTNFEIDFTLFFNQKIILNEEFVGKIKKMIKEWQTEIENSIFVIVK
jgi:hypothetical protein